MATTTIEVRWHGRGGQGVVTASKLLAETALDEGKYFQALPEYGAERSGAPIRAFTRISSQPIVSHSQVTEPDVVVVLDPTLLGGINVAEGLKKDGTLVVNTSQSPAEVRARLRLDGRRVYTVDASRIAREHIGRSMANTPMLGALIKAVGIVDKEGMLQEMRKKLGPIMRPEVLEGNIRAFSQAYDETRSD